MKKTINHPDFDKDYQAIVKSTKSNVQVTPLYFDTTKMIKKYTAYNENLKCKTVTL